MNAIVEVWDSIKEATKGMCKALGIYREYDYFVLNKVTTEYGHYTYEDTIVLINQFGADNFIIFDADDQLKIVNNIIFNKEVPEKEESE